MSNHQILLSFLLYDNIEGEGWHYGKGREKGLHIENTKEFTLENRKVCAQRKQNVKFVVFKCR